MSRLNNSKWTGLLYIVFFISCYSCNNQEKKKKAEDTTGIQVDLRCDSLLNIFNSKDLCGKINVIDSLGSLKYNCLVEMAREFSRITGLKNSMNYGTGGVFYPADSLLREDILYWRNKLNCK